MAATVSRLLIPGWLKKACGVTYLDDEERRSERCQSGVGCSSLAASEREICLWRRQEFPELNQNEWGGKLEHPGLRRWECWLRPDQSDTLLNSITEHRNIAAPAMI